jgi:FlaA1/EpsC-like NDP-sugar epimerase
VLRVGRLVLEQAVRVVSLMSAFAYRFESPLPPERWMAVSRLLVSMLLIQQLALLLSGAHRYNWRYVGIRDIEDVALATTGVAAPLMVRRFAPTTPSTMIVPVCVVLANWVLATEALKHTPPRSPDSNAIAERARGALLQAFYRPTFHPGVVA